jgi:hypothetical protein
MRILISLAALTVVATPAMAQSDLQPGRNFPTAATAFAGNHSENVDVGDIDNDGDLEVGIANGGDSGPQPNRLYLNNGNLQGGTQGTFSQVTASRLAGVPNDTSRDLEFVDVDLDNDLDMYISNRGTTTNNGEVSRAYINQGGKQLGTIGFFSEETNTFWGDLVSVPLNEEVGTQDGKGPWKDFSCDCDFGDLDNDGDLDLFHSSYGPNINATRDSRLFLNDGKGVFNELSPWINAGGDIQTHTLDIDLADFDGDYDLDVFNSSRNSQARVYRNNLSGTTWGGTPFTDITQSALLNQGAVLTGTSNYEAEFGDVDGDGDFDVWAKNYNGFTDRILRNNGNFTFTQVNSLISGDPSVDENEIDFLDYDSDGDLDAFLANFSGTNAIYQSNLMDGGGGALYKRNGTAGANWQEVPSSGNSGTTLDGEAADLDGDGDPDLILSNDAGQQNRLWMNALGVPDTHAPTFERFIEQGDKSDGTDTVILAQVRDNNNYYNIDYYKAYLIYTVDGGDENCVEMLAQRGQQFRGVIPGSVNGAVSYRIECTDDNGNTGTSATINYTQTSSTPVLWENLGHGTKGYQGRRPYLELTGAQTVGSDTEFKVHDANPSSLAILWLSLISVPVNAVGTTIYANPFNSQIFFATDTGGTFYAGTPWPAGIPSGTDHWWQVIVQDSASIHGLTVTNAVHGQQP